jgi:hypothetical protein
MADQRGFFDLDERYAALSRAGDPLERLAAVVDFELFRPELDAALKRSDRKKGGRPPMDPVFGPSLRPMASGASLFKVLVLQALYNLSDAQAEFQILDRRSFGRFLGIDDGDRVPDGEPRSAPPVRAPRRTRSGAFARLWCRRERSSGCSRGSTRICARRGIWR